MRTKKVKTQDSQHHGNYTNYRLNQQNREYHEVRFICEELDGTDQIEQKDLLSVIQLLFKNNVQNGKLKHFTVLEEI